MLPLFILSVAIQPADAERFAKWEKEVAAIEKRLADAPPKPGGVLFYGSSSIRLWDLKKSFPKKPYLNAGFGGSEVRDCTHFLPRLVTPHKPAVVVFYAGDNDIASGRKAEQVAEDFKAFCMALHKELPECRVLYLPVKPSLARWSKFEEQKKANALMKDLCSADKRLVYIDTVPGMLGADGKPIPDLFVKDGLHMSPAGYEKWTALVSAALEK
jgi:lysophospholipase L1-like esterase